MDTVVRKMVAVMALCVSLSRCEPLALSNQYGVPGNFVGNAPQGNQYQQQQTVTNSYGAPLADGHGHDEHQDYIDSQPKSYEFGYAVRDAASGNDFGRRETSDGETVRGEYRVQLPDGRTQIVTYTADWRTGFHADVRYEGVAQFPDQYNTGNQGYNNNANNANNNNNNNDNNNNNINGNINSNSIGNNFHKAAYDYAGNNIDSAYNNVAGNRGGYNNYQSAANNYNSGSNYNYQYGSNSVDSGYSSGNSFGPSVSPPLSPPQPTYGVPFH